MKAIARCVLLFATLSVVASAQKLAGLTSISKDIPKIRPEILSIRAL